MDQQPTVTAITDNVSDLAISTTGPDTAGVSVMIGSDESIGSGTLSLGVFPQRAAGTDDSVDIAHIDATLDAGHNQYYRVGAGMTVYIKLTGATNPNANVICSPVPGLD